MLRSGARERPTPTEARIARAAREQLKLRVCELVKNYKSIWNRKKSLGEPEVTWALIAGKVGESIQTCKKEYMNVRKSFQGRINKVLNVHHHYTSWEEIIDCINNYPIARSRNVPEVWIKTHDWLGKAIAEEILENRRNVRQLDVLEELLGESPNQAEAIADPDLQVGNVLPENGEGEAAILPWELLVNPPVTTKARAQKRKAIPKRKTTRKRKKPNVTIVKNTAVVVPVAVELGPNDEEEEAQSHEVTFSDLKIEMPNGDNTIERMVIRVQNDVPSPPQPTVDPPAAPKGKRGRPPKKQENDNFEEQVKLKIKATLSDVLERLYISNMGNVPSEISKIIVERTRNFVNESKLNRSVAAFDE